MFSVTLTVSRYWYEANKSERMLIMIAHFLEARGGGDGAEDLLAIAYIAQEYFVKSFRTLETRWNASTY